MATRFTNLGNPKAGTASFKAKRRVSLFLSMARSEIAMVCALVLVFWNLHGTVSDTLLTGGLIIASALASLAIRQSAVARRAIFVGSVLVAEVLLVLNRPIPEIPAAGMALAFVLADIFLFTQMAGEPEEG